MSATNAKLKIAVLALKEIALARGPYKMDRLEHAEATIEAMQTDAKKALSEIERTF